MMSPTYVEGFEERLGKVLEMRDLRDDVEGVMVCPHKRLGWGS